MIETFQISNLILHIQLLEEQKQTKPRACRRKEITKIRAELNDIVTKRTIQMINKHRSFFFEKINRIKKALSIFIKKNRGPKIKKKHQKWKKRDCNWYHRNTKECKKLLWKLIFEIWKPGWNGKFPEKYKSSKTEWRSSKKLKQPITADEIKAVIKMYIYMYVGECVCVCVCIHTYFFCLSTHKKSPVWNSFTGEIYKTFKEELTLSLRLLQKIHKVGRFRNLFMKPASS